MFKFKISAEDYEKLNDIEKALYAASGDGYQAQIEGAVSKEKVDEFRTSNIDLANKLKSFDGVDMEKVSALMAQEAKLQDAKFIESKDFDGLVESKTNAMKSDYEAKIATLTEQLTSQGTQYNGLVSKYEIEGAATKAFGEHKINPEAFDSVMAQIKSKFSIDNGQVVARNGDNILAGADGNLTVSEFVASQPEIFKIQSSGGHAQGNNNPTPIQQSQSSQQMITSGLSKLMG